MTLLISITTSNTAVIVSDMRLSSDGIIVENQEVKATFLETSDARAIFAYTGIASSETDAGHRFVTQEWLCQTLHSCVRSGTPLITALAEVRKRASTEFRLHPAITARLPSERRLTIIFTGFVYIQTQWFLHHSPINAIISNFQDPKTEEVLSQAQSEFFFDYKVGSPIRSKPWTMFGADRLVPQEAKTALTDLIDRGAPLEAVKGKAIDIVSELSNDVRANNAVGPNAMVATLRSDVSILPDSYNHSATGGEHVSLHGIVSWRSKLMIAGIRLNTLDAAPPHLPRRAPCWCRSGKKFKNCHGKLKLR